MSVALRNWFEQELEAPIDAGAFLSTPGMAQAIGTSPILARMLTHGDSERGLCIPECPEGYDISQVSFDGGPLIVLFGEVAPGVKVGLPMPRGRRGDILVWRNGQEYHLEGPGKADTPYAGRAPKEYMRGFPEIT